MNLADAIFAEYVQFAVQVPALFKRIAEIEIDLDGG
jgi:hypothetical protein